ncbi:MAG TPA: hypothetical protein VER11_34545 [Polyangiaceae bacterium]|nr:hypothetical protein [Polyangiaceae bacterium]
MNDSGPCWSEIRPGLIELFTELAQNPRGIQAPEWKAEWQDGPRKAATNSGLLHGVTLTLRITTIVGVGSGDEIRYEEAGQDLQETIYGLRKVTLNLQCESSQPSDAQWPMSILERIRTRMSRGRVTDRLLDLNVGVIDILAARDISSKARAHTLSRANMDVLLTMVASDRDPVVTGVLAKVEITSLLEDTDGAVMPQPPNFTTTVTTP